MTNKHEITRVTKQEMVIRWGKPYFGYTLNYPDGRSEVWLRNDLPERVMKSVETHEMQHVKDRAFLDGRVWHWEFSAWGAQVKADWFGALQTIRLSLADKSRIWLYWQRITKGF